MKNEDTNEVTVVIPFVRWILQGLMNLKEMLTLTMMTRGLIRKQTSQLQGVLEDEKLDESLATPSSCLTMCLKASWAALMVAACWSRRRSPASKTLSPAAVSRQAWTQARPPTLEYTWVDDSRSARGPGSMGFSARCSGVRTLS